MMMRMCEESKSMVGVRFRVEVGVRVGMSAEVEVKMGMKARAMGLHEGLDAALQWRNW